MDEFDRLLALSTPALAKEALSHDKLKEQAARVHPTPTEPQKDAGNYRKGHVSWKGLGITIETAKGQYRRGKGKDGKPWQTLMKDSYGYIKCTHSEADGDHVDVFLCDAYLDSEIVFVVNQVDPDSGKFDEHKVILGCVDEKSAKDTYLRNYQPGWKGLGSITALTLDQFKWWLKHADTAIEVKDGYFAAPKNRKKAADLKNSFETPGTKQVVVQKRAADKKKPFTVAVDLDGTLAEQMEPFDPEQIGAPREHAKEWLDTFHEAGARIIIFTVRGDTDLVADWLDEHGIHYDYINENPDQPEGSSGKIIADVYLDDRAVNARDLDHGAAEVLWQIHQYNAEAEEAEEDGDEEEPAPVLIEKTTVLRMVFKPEDIAEVMEST